MEGEDEHECFIQPSEKKEPQTAHMLYDCETRVHNGKHLVRNDTRPEHTAYTSIAHNASGLTTLSSWSIL